MDSLRHICCWVFIALTIAPASSQHLHLSSYDHSPIVLSPALSGAFKGSLRIGGSFREQFRAFIVEPYETTMINVDMPMATRLPEGQWMGLGVQLGNTVAGDLGLTVTSVSTNLAYHRKLGRRKNATIGMGMQYAMNMMQVDNSAGAHFEDELNGSVDRSLDHSLLENLSNKGKSFSAGMYFQKRHSKKLTYRLGLAFQNILRQEDKLSSQDHSFSKQLSVHMDWNYRLGKKWMIHAQFLYQQLSFSKNIVAAMGTSYRMRKTLVLKSRLGHRWNDAMMVSAGADFGQYSVLVTYDMTTSSASTYNGSHGAFEIGFSRFFIWHPKAKKKVIQICPRL